MKNNKKLKLFYRIGQSTAEYAVLLAIIAAALIAMQVYLKRGIQGRLRGLADQLTDAAGTPNLYQPGGTNSYSNTVQSGTKYAVSDGLKTSSGQVESVETYGADTSAVDIDK